MGPTYPKGMPSPRGVRTRPRRFRPASRHASHAASIHAEAPSVPLDGRSAGGWLVTPPARHGDQGGAAAAVPGGADQLGTTSRPAFSHNASSSRHCCGV